MTWTLIVITLATGRGFEQYNSPGWSSRATCEAAAAEIRSKPRDPKVWSATCARPLTIPAPR